MNATTRTVLVLATAALASSCGTFTRLEPGKATEADVRRALGEPAKVYAEAGGLRQLAYPRGPEGVETFMAHVAADGALVRFEQVLTENRMRQVVRGRTTGDELERLIGPPWRTVPFPNKAQVAWDYVFQDAWGYTVDYSVMLDAKGVVAETAYARREPGDGGMH